MIDESTIFLHQYRNTSKGDFKLPLDLLSYLLKEFKFSKYLEVIDVGAFRGGVPRAGGRKKR
jgi:hypothetical protein